MDLTDETTVKGILLAITAAQNWAIIKLWNKNQADTKAFKELAEHYILTMKELIMKKVEK